MERHRRNYHSHYFNVNFNLVTQMCSSDGGKTHKQTHKIYQWILEKSSPPGKRTLCDCDGLSTIGTFEIRIRYKKSYGNLQTT